MSSANLAPTSAHRTPSGFGRGSARRRFPNSTSTNALSAAPARRHVRHRPSRWQPPAGSAPMPEPSPVASVHISSAVVSVLPAHRDEVVLLLSAMPGVEVHYLASSKIVIV